MSPLGLVAIIGGIGLFVVFLIIAIILSFFGGNSPSRTFIPNQASATTKVTSPTGWSPPPGGGRTLAEQRALAGSPPVATEHVNGYTRKDGTYVKGYDRRAK